MTFIRIQNLTKVYRTDAGDFPALKKINLSIERGELISLVGRSGSGKTTLLNMLTGIDHPTEGEIMIDQVPVHALREDDVAAWRGRHVGIVFQFFQLLPLLTIEENILMALDFANSMPRGKRQQRVQTVLAQVGILEQAGKFPSQLSGGQQQRAAIARALANDPPLIVADEPTGNLDTKTADSIMTLFEQLALADRTIVIVTHDPALAARTQRTVTLVDGAIVKQDEVRGRDDIHSQKQPAFA